MREREKIDKNKMYLIFFLLIPIFQPKIFTQYKVTTIIYIAGNLVELMMYIYFFYKKNIKFSKISIYWSMYMLYYLLIMIANVNYGGILQWGYLFLMIVNFIFLCELSCPKYENELLCAISKLGQILLTINFITLIIYKRGIIQSTFFNNTDGDYYFLGIKTQFTSMIFPTITSAIIYYINTENKGAKIQLIFGILVSCLNIFYKHISTAILGIFIIIGMYIFLKKFKIKYNYKICIVIALLLQIAIVFFNIQTFFGGFIQNVLHKDVTLSSRVYIWQNAKELLEKESVINLVFGNGKSKNNNFVLYSGSYWQPHNQMLAWIYNTGIVGTILILYFFSILLRENASENDKYQLLLIICFTELVLSVSEVYFDIAICYVPFFLAYYCQKNNLYEKEEKK